jgi:adenylate cyclase class IV
MRSASKTARRKSGRSGPKSARTEIEVKLRIADRRGLLRQLARLKAKLIAPRVHEMNTLYDTQDGKLARQGQMLRLRVERLAHGAPGAGKRSKHPGVSALLTYKGPGASSKKGSRRAPRAASTARYKIREEHELRLGNHEEMPRILEALGLHPWFRYEKFRSTYCLPGMAHLKLELDETPIGPFLEIEGGRGRIDRSAALLGFARSDYIDRSYGALYMEHCGLGRGAAPQSEPTPFSGLPDMLFRRSKHSKERS